MIGRFVLGLSVVVAGLGGSIHAAGMETVQVCQNGKAMLSVVIGPKTSDPVRDTAKKLAHILGRIGNTEFAVDAGDGSSGIVVGRVENSLPELTHQMYRHLAAARELAGEDPDVRTRIDHLILYTRYVELYHQYTSAEEGLQDQSKAELLTHIWRIRETMMVHAYALWARLVGEKEALNNESPLKSDEPVTERELLGFLHQTR